MAVPLINISAFTLVPSDNSCIYLHEVDKGRLSTGASLFFRKTAESATIAHLELLAQEFFRLIIPSQPLTLLAHNPEQDIYYILSEEVQGYQPLPLNQHTRFVKGDYPGLGQIMLTAIFLQEIDLKNGNVGLDSYNRVMKIDGDWCFAGIRDSDFSDKIKTITARLLDTLPFPSGYYSYNWLDIVMYGIGRFGSSIVDARLASAPYFRQEVNEAILKILTIPDNYIRRFVYTYVPMDCNVESFIKFLIDRKAELQKVALDNASFKHYLCGDEAQRCIPSHLKHLQEFIANNSTPIVNPVDRPVLVTEGQALYNNLNAQIKLESMIRSLEALCIDFSKIATRKQLNNEHNRLLSIIGRINAAVSNEDSQINQASLDDFMTQVQKKIKLIESKYQTLIERFKFLEKIEFTVHYHEFLNKKTEMSKKAKHSSAYNTALPIATKLCDSLQQVKRAFLHSSLNFNEAKTIFISDCKSNVTSAKSALKEHREWLGALRKFLIVLLSCITQGYSNKYLGVFAKTDTVMKLEAFADTLTEQPPNSYSGHI
jgi:hypothetical protein